MPVQVFLPIRIKTDPGALEERQYDVQEALSAAAGRALTNSRNVVLERRGGYVGVKLHAPEVTWSGDGLADVPASVRAEIEALVRAALDREAKAAGLGELPQGKGLPTPPLKATAAEPLDDARYDPLAQSYELPIYDRGGAGVPVPIQDPSAGRDPFRPPTRAELAAGRRSAEPTVPIDLKEMAKRLRGSNVTDRGIAFLQIQRRVVEGDEAAFYLALLAIQPDDSSPTVPALSSLKQLSRRHPRRFKELLRGSLQLGRPVTLRRSDTDIQIDAELLPTLMDMAAGVARLASEVPSARELLAERERITPGMLRVIGLANLLLQSRLELLAYLRESKESTDSDTLESFRSATFGLARLPGLFAAFAGDERLNAMVYDLQLDLTENQRWISNVLQRIRAIDELLAFFRFLYGDASAQQDEVAVLLEARGGYLKELGGALVKAERVRAVRTQAEANFKDWLGAAANRKRDRLKKSVDSLKRLLGSLGQSAHYGYFRPVDRPYNDKLAETRQTLEQIEKEIGGAAKGGSDLGQLAAIEGKLPIVGARISLLSYWYASLELGKVIDYPQQLGSAKERQSWSAQLQRIRAEIGEQYRNPQYADLNSKFRDWKWDLEMMQIEMKGAARREFAVNLLINVAALLITAKVGATMTGARMSAVTVTVAEAATFTTVTALGQTVLQSKSFDPGDVAAQFVDNAILFGAFKVLGAGLMLGAQKLLPQRTLAQLAVVLGTPALLATGAPLVISRLERGRWPEEIFAFIVANLLLSAISGAIAGPSTLRSLRTLEGRAQAAQLAQLRAELETLNRQRTQWLAEMERVIGSGQLSKEQFESAQTKGTQLYSDLEALVNRMSAQLTEQTLASIGLSLGQLRWLASEARSYSGQIAAARYPGMPATRGLPSPTEVVSTGLVRTGPGTLEYNPYLAGTRSPDLAARFRRAGYRVTDMGGGVLRLTGRTLDQTAQFLLPARTDVAPPELADLAGGPRTVHRKGLTVLQQQPGAAQLLAQLRVMVGSQGAGVTRALLRAVGRFLRPNDTQEIAGLGRFLSVGGDPEALTTLLSPKETGEWTVDVRKALRVMQTFTLPAAQGLKDFFDLSPTYGAGTGLRVFHNFEPGQLAGIFETIHDLRGRSLGLEKLVPGLRGDNPQMYKGVIGVLTTASQELSRYPDATLIFEDPILSGTGRTIRITDIRVVRPGVSSHLRIEVKEIYRLSSLGRDAVRELANDIVNDATMRRSLPTPVGSSRPFFETVSWRIRYNELAVSAAKRLRIANIDDPAVRRQVADDVKRRLRPAFTHWVIRQAVQSGTLSQAEVDGYLRAFDADLPFVSFF